MGGQRWGRGRHVDGGRGAPALPPHYRRSAAAFGRVPNPCVSVCVCLCLCQIPSIGALLVLDSDGRRIAAKVRRLPFAPFSLPFARARALPPLPRSPPPPFPCPPRSRREIFAANVVVPCPSLSLSPYPSLAALSAQYHGDRYATHEMQAEFERSIFSKTRGSTARSDPDIILLNKQVIVYQFATDVYFYVAGDQNENELILSSVLTAFYETMDAMLRCVLGRCCPVGPAAHTQPHRIPLRT